MSEKKDKKPALGRGLSALLGEVPDVGVVSQDSPSRIKVGTISKIALDDIETNPWQPRNSFEEEALAELSESIRKQGLIQPVTVRVMENGKYQLISGERRLRASKMAGLTMITAYVRTADDMQMMEMALMENIQREDLNPIEIALSLHRLQDECKITQEDLAVRVSKSRSAVTNYLRLLKLSAPVQAALCRNEITMGHARALLALEDGEQQESLMQEIISKELSVRQVEDRVRQIQQPETEKTAKVKVVLPMHYEDARQRLSDHLQSPVEIKRDLRGRGSVTIKFKSDEEFERILSLMQ